MTLDDLKELHHEALNAGQIDLASILATVAGAMAAGRLHELAEHTERFSRQELAWIRENRERRN